MSKVIKAKVQFKDPDLTYALQDQGMSEEAADKIRARAEFGEYFSFEIHFDSRTGKVLGAKQLDSSDGA